jgi:hypothetical protein
MANEDKFALIDEIQVIPCDDYAQMRKLKTFLIDWCQATYQDEWGSDWRPVGHPAEALQRSV